MAPASTASVPEDADTDAPADGELREVVVDAAEDALLAEIAELEELDAELAEEAATQRSPRGERQRADGGETVAEVEAHVDAMVDVEEVHASRSRASSLIATPGSASVSSAGTPGRSGSTVDIIEVR